jgi:hypothetical protein
MFKKPLESITRQDLENLVATAVPESAALDYKEKLPGGSDGDKKDFLADVSAFANAAGGHIIYGVKEKKGPDGQGLDTPEAIIGLEISNPSTEVTRLQQIIDSNIDPKIPGVHVQDLPHNFEKGPVIIVGIPSSWVSPHIVTFKEDFRFYLRIGRKKVRMDLDHIRSAILGEGAQLTYARDFRNARLGALISRKTPVEIPTQVMTALHVIPIAKKFRDQNLNIEPMEKLKEEFAPIGWKTHYEIRTRFNFDGILAWLKTENTPLCKSECGYIQLYRNGRIEAVDTDFTRIDARLKDIPSEDFEKFLVAALKRYLEFLFKQGIFPPIMIGLTMIGVKDYYMSHGGNLREYANKKIDRENLIFPEKIIEDQSILPQDILKESFDMLWQASGYPGSPNYDLDGYWLLAL